ncbi:homeobox protein NANOG-like [Oreochromis niloticus]|uniref:homeobox protein NANOG-like n=1 Tax=Oreochromis niloticus TaxID=8128 RepID=UPI000DF16017|nr:homeobox protein NANOG-like [Oreochromis niloticus]
MEDYGMHFSPDSWSYDSGPEGSLSLEELATWVESALEKELSNKTTDTSEAVSSSVSEQKQDFAVPRSQDGNITATLHDPSTATEKPKGKARVVFTERQLNVLVHQFNAKHYYDPREMKQLAEMTGLTYKQVKTWFQNKRSKFRRSSHPQHVNQGVPLHFQGEGQPPHRESYTQHLEMKSIANGANYQAPYHHAVGNFAAGPQWTFPTSPHMFDWSMPPGNGNKGGLKYETDNLKNLELSNGSQRFSQEYLK